MSMIVSCAHAREIGIITAPCCSHCHGPAGLAAWDLPDGHEAWLCCARTTAFTPEEIARILANIPEWEAREAPPSP